MTNSFVVEALPERLTAGRGRRAEEVEARHVELPDGGLVAGRGDAVVAAEAELVAVVPQCSGVSKKKRTWAPSAMISCELPLKLIAQTQ